MAEKTSYSYSHNEFFKSDITKIHFIGIGGIGMCGIAEILLSEGFTISGSDLYQTQITNRLTNLGIKIFIGHNPANLDGVDVVVRSAAIKDSNVEIQAAYELKIPIISRAEMLAELMRLRCSIAVSGTHGKTTITSLISYLLFYAGLDPSYIIGGLLKDVETGARVGKGKHLIVEADESDASFLFLYPIISIISNIDLDHMGTYEWSVHRLYEAFNNFLHRLPFYGIGIVCIDDAGVLAILEKNIHRKIITYGFNSAADFHICDFNQVGLKTFFKVNRKNKHPIDIELNLSGKHNAVNALASIAIASILDIPDCILQNALRTFPGVKRRLELHGEFILNDKKIKIIEDYGHHPNELKTVFNSLREAWNGNRIIMIYQPHRYSRTKELFNEFVDVLLTADVLILLDVYPAGEAYMQDYDSRALYEAIKARNKFKENHIILSTKSTIVFDLANMLNDNDIVVFQGAGDIGALCAQIIKLLESA